MVASKDESQSVNFVKYVPWSIFYIKMCSRKQLFDNVGYHQSIQVSGTKKYLISVLHLIVLTIWCSCTNFVLLVLLDLCFLLFDSLYRTASIVLMLMVGGVF